jgi:hypothetical protein
LCLGKENLVDQSGQTQINPAQQCGVGMGVKDKFIIQPNWHYEKKPEQNPHKGNDKEVPHCNANMFF